MWINSMTFQSHDFSNSHVSFSFDISSTMVVCTYWTLSINLYFSSQFVNCPDFADFLSMFVDRSFYEPIPYKALPCLDRTPQDFIYVSEKLLVYGSNSDKCLVHN